MRVRPATDADMPSLLLGVSVFADEAYPNESVDTDRVATFLRATIGNPDGLVAVMETDRGMFAGLFVALLHRNLLTGLPSMGEILFYVDPEARGHGKRLLTYAEDWARDRGCKRATLCHLETTPRLETAYRRWGYVPLERSYQKELT